MIAAALIAGGCGEKAAPSDAPPPVAGGLEAGVVARVGGRAIAASSIGRIAAAQGIDPREARDLAVRDALLAEGAAASGLDRSLDVTLSERAVLARRILRAIRAEAERAGDPTEAEIQAAADRRWLDVDRPAGSRTAHAVVRFDASAPEETRRRAIDLAEQIRAAALEASKKAGDLPAPASPSTAQKDALAGAFQQAIDPIVKADHGGLQVRVESLPTVAGDGRVLGPKGERLDPAFARAAAALGRRGDLSPVTISPFGAHVILLLERTAPIHLEGEERRRVLRDDVVNARAAIAEEQLLQGLRRKSGQTKDADALLALVTVQL